MEYAFRENVLGTVLSVRIRDTSSPEEVFSRALAHARTFEERYSRFIPRNYLDSLNANGGGVVDEDLHAMLSFSLELARISDGYFDPTIAPLLDAYGYGNAPRSDTPPPEIRRGYEHVRLDGERLTLDSGVRIELGGVGKGFLLGRIVSLFDGFGELLVDFGGDIYGRGGWDIALEHPHDPTLAIGTVHLTDGYFCASSGLRRRFGDFHHLLDARSGLPARDIIASFVEAESGMVADGYATLLCVCPRDRSIALLHESPIAGAIVTADTKIHTSEHTAIRFF